MHRVPLLCYATDNAFDRSSVKAIIGLRFPQAKLHLVENGEELLGWLESQAPDRLPHILLLDFLLPHQTGYLHLGKIAAINGCESIPTILFMEGSSSGISPECVPKYQGGRCVQKSSPLDGMEKELTEAILAICRSFPSEPAYSALAGV